MTDSCPRRPACGCAPGICARTPLSSDTELRRLRDARVIAMTALMDISFAELLSEARTIAREAREEINRLLTE
jgi:hypothetical protein